MNVTVLNSTSKLADALVLMKACQPLVARLAAQGVTIKLSRKEETSLLGFSEVEQTNFSKQDWSYLRLAGGVNVSGVAALKSCLTRYQAIASQV